MMPYLTAPEVYTTKQLTYRYFVELASNQLDCEEVSESFRIVDVVVLEPAIEAIETVIAAAGWLADYTVVSYWVPTDCDCF